MPQQPLVADVRFVTLSATYGAGGSVIGPLLARRVGLPFADRLLPARDAPVPPSGEGVNEEEREEEPRRSFFARLANLNVALNFPAPRDPEDLRDHVRDGVEQSIRELAATGGAVLLGRAGQIVLARHPVRVPRPARRSRPNGEHGVARCGRASTSRPRTPA